MIPQTDADIECAARTLYGEARGEPYEGQIAVACVIITRANVAQKFVASHSMPHPLFGDGTLMGACLVPWQFSCWNEGDPNRELIMSLGDGDPGLLTMIGRVRAALYGSPANPAPGATHYVVTSLVPETSWTKGATLVATVGNHSFFADVH